MLERYIKAEPEIIQHQIGIEDHQQTLVDVDIVLEERMELGQVAADITQLVEMPDQSSQSIANNFTILRPILLDLLTGLVFVHRDKLLVPVIFRQEIYVV